MESPFAENLRQILAERELSIRGAAEICEVSVSQIHDWMQGTQCTNPMALLKLCRALKCDFQWLLTGTRGGENKSANLSEIFDIQPEPAFSGIFMIEAKRLRKREE
jgi:transcriptional regulator with XRE-family HTH domain